MKTCAVMLLPNDLIWSRLNRSLPLLKKNLLDKYPIDYVIFHEDGFSEVNKKEIRNRVNSVIFKQIKFNIPESAKNFKPLWATGWSLEKCTSYGGMCTFFTKDVFEILIDIKQEDTILDIGANTGIFSIYAKKLYGCKIVAFEPVPDNFENFKKNIILNGFTLEDFEIHQVAITNRDGDVIQIGTPVNNSGRSSIYSTIRFHHDMDNITYTSECITESLRKYIDDSCVYLKLDCEGCEYDIIPDIIDKLKTFKWIGAELHIYTPDHDASGLLRSIRENFSGELYSGVIKL